jgi:hypothetical protein
MSTETAEKKQNNVLGFRPSDETKAIIKRKQDEFLEKFNIKLSAGSAIETMLKEYKELQQTT